MRSDREQEQLVLTQNDYELELCVPLQDAKLAEELGAEWDSEDEIWYVPAGKSLEPFAKWFLDKHGANVRSSSYYIMQSEHQCWKCEAVSNVFGFMLPSGHETIVNGKWQSSNEQSIISVVSFIPESVQHEVLSFTSDFNTDLYMSPGAGTYVNHCSVCKANQSDNALHEEPREAFNPWTAEEASRILLYHIKSPFKAACGAHTFDVPLFSFMRQAQHKKEG